jgi:hypothetical protein
VSRRIEQQPHRDTPVIDRRHRNGQSVVSSREESVDQLERAAGARPDLFRACAFQVVKFIDHNQRDNECQIVLVALLQFASPVDTVERFRVMDVDVRGEQKADLGCLVRCDALRISARAATMTCVKRWWLALMAMALLLSACTGASGRTASSTIDLTSTTGSSVVAPIRHGHSPLDVVIQIGDYYIGPVPDLILSSPDLLVLGDGTVYSDQYNGAVESVATFRRGAMSETTIQRLLQDASTLPPDATVGQGLNEFPVLLEIGTQRWKINDLNAEPSAGYLDEVRAAVRAAATQTWQPSRWIESEHVAGQPYGSVKCAVVASTNVGPHSAPVYPNAFDRYPIGAFPCFG